MDFRKGKGREELEINLIPFIDVLLVILIFMMVTTTYSKVSALQITLPTNSADKADQRANKIAVGIDAQGHYSIKDVKVSAVDENGLAEELKHAAAEMGEEGKDPVIEINADALATHQSVMNVLSAAGNAGFEKITFSHNKSDKK